MNFLKQVFKNTHNYLGLQHVWKTTVFTTFINIEESGTKLLSVVKFNKILIIYLVSTTHHIEILLTEDTYSLVLLIKK